jgi:hypothetical protein
MCLVLKKVDSFNHKTSAMDKLIKQVFVKRRGNGPRKSTEPYDVKLKAKIIKEYLQGDASFRMLSDKYKIHPGVKT